MKNLAWWKCKYCYKFNYTADKPCWNCGSTKEMAMMPGLGK